MNNKVRVKKFFEMGGVVMIELRKDWCYMFGKPWLIGANSLKSLREVFKELREITYLMVEKTGHTNIDIVMLICSVSFELDGFWYECEKFFLLRESDYLYIKERICK